MTIAAWIILVVIFVAVCKVLHMLLTCRPGWEDEQGFHEGERVQQKLNIARKALRELEWDEHYLGRHGHCPYCGQTRQDGHMSECIVFLSLEDK